MPLFPTSVDLPNPMKNISTVYEPQILMGTIAVGGSISSIFNLDGWTQFALQVTPNGTILGGTVLSIYAAQSQQGTYYPVAGTSGVTASTLQIGSTAGVVISPLPQLTPLRYVQFVAGGTQSNAQILTLLVK